MKIVTILLSLALFTSLIGCERRAELEVKDKPLVVATTTMLEDVVRQIGGDDLEVYGLVKPGADPHTYQPRPSDARQISRSDAVVMNGLLLEGWMESLIRNAGGERPILVAGEAIGEADIFRVQGAMDPHIWFDLTLWRQAVAHIGAGLVELAGDDEAMANRLLQRAADYDRLLEELHKWVVSQIQSIPEEQRLLVTSHDAFNYFGRAYGIEVWGVQGLSTEQEASQRDVANMIELAKSRNAPAVFTETSVHPGLIEQVAREAKIEVAGPLFSDSVGGPGSGAETYIKMVQQNVAMITQALGGNYQGFEHSMATTAEEQDEEEV